MKTKKITIHINLDTLGIRLLLLAILVASLGGSIAFAQDASSEDGIVPITTGPVRKYYLTMNGFQGNGVLTACATGYHAATLWEILDTSNLVYDTVLGVKWPSGDSTPPTGIWGWARTGGAPNIGEGAGSNCASWTIGSALQYGTLIELPDDWTTPGSKIGIWKTGFGACFSSFYVWCVGD